ncbi:ZIP family metal transporter [Lawsonia intracellularis]|uniref:ZIP family metal transporter n=1 Tax=Lawsonia intracellularis TaxID=29546 RepID=UPI001CBD6395|nr:ZIP family metal transporter [Lawsonia intracellularis]MBZ3893119.1 ZIP family metal transporter [Lawsonia intracellularis]
MIIEQFFNTPIGMALLAGIVIWGFTTVGAAVVFISKEFSRRTLDLMLGFAGGIMIAASYWSLLEPALEMSEYLGKWSLVPVGSGVILGAAFLRLLDYILPHIHIVEGVLDGRKSKLPRSTLLVLAITLHNIPEGLAVSGPLLREGYSRKKAFLFGLFSGIVEPIAVIIGALAVTTVTTLLPFALAFAAGAMIFVVVEEVVPESYASGNGDSSSMAIILGFVVMMCFDVLLG